MKAVTKKAAFKTYVEQAFGWDEKEQRQLHDMRFPSQEFYVIQTSGIDVGILAMVREPDCVKINQLFIRTEHQSGGIGLACMTHMMKDAEALGLPVRLRVLKVNSRAIVFYQRLGFNQVGENNTHLLMEKCP